MSARVLPRVVVRLATANRPALAWVGFPTGSADEDGEVLTDVVEIRVEDGRAAERSDLCLPAESEGEYLVNHPGHGHYLLSWVDAVEEGREAAVREAEDALADARSALARVADGVAAVAAWVDAD